MKLPSPIARSQAFDRPLRFLALLAVALLSLFNARASWGAAGDLDPTFGIGGILLTDIHRSNDLGYAVALQPDGRIVVVGIRFVGNDAANGDFAVVRHNPDGSLDRSFGRRGKVITDFGLTETALAVVVQPDGRIVVAGGTYPIFPFLGQFALARYNSDGSLDTTFGVGGLVRTGFGSEGASATALLLQADGKIIAGGTKFIVFSNEMESDTDFALARYLGD